MNEKTYTKIHEWRASAKIFVEWNQFTDYSGVSTERLTTKQIKNTINSIHSSRMNEERRTKVLFGSISHLSCVVYVLFYFIFKLYCVWENSFFASSLKSRNETLPPGVRYLSNPSHRTHSPHQQNNASNTRHFRGF